MNKTYTIKAKAQKRTVKNREIKYYLISLVSLLSVQFPMISDTGFHTFWVASLMQPAGEISSLINIGTTEKERELSELLIKFGNIKYKSP